MGRPETSSRSLFVNSAATGPHPSGRAIQHLSNGCLGGIDGFNHGYIRRGVDCNLWLTPFKGVPSEIKQGSVVREVDHSTVAAFAAGTASPASFRKDLSTRESFTGVSLRPSNRVRSLGREDQPARHLRCARPGQDHPTEFSYPSYRYSFDMIAAHAKDRFALGSTMKGDVSCSKVR